MKKGEKIALKKAQEVIELEAPSKSFIKKTIDDLIGGASELVDGLWGFKKGITIDEIKDINKTFGGLTEIGSTVETALHGALNYESFWDKTASISRIIVGSHLFDNGNKRTAMEVIKTLMERNGVVTGVAESEMRVVLTKIAEGTLKDVKEIAKALRGF